MATKKVTVTIPEDLLDEIRADAAERGLSAYVAPGRGVRRQNDRTALGLGTVPAPGRRHREGRGPPGTPPPGRRQAARPQVRDRRRARRDRATTKGTGHRLHLGRRRPGEAGPGHDRRQEGVTRPAPLKGPQLGRHQPGSGTSRTASSTGSWPGQMRQSPYLTGLSSLSAATAFATSDPARSHASCARSAAVLLTPRPRHAWRRP